MTLPASFLCRFLFLLVCTSPRDTKAGPNAAPSNESLGPSTVSLEHLHPEPSTRQERQVEIPQATLAIPAPDYDIDDLRQRLSAEGEGEEGEDEDGEDDDNESNLSWIMDRNKRHLGSIARQGLLEARRLRSFDLYGDDPYEDEVTGGILAGDDLFFPYDTYEGDEYHKEGKRNIASAARLRMIPYQKRHIGHAAKLGYLSSFRARYPNAFKRYIGALAKNGGLSHRISNPGKRHIGVLARQGGLPRPRPKRSTEEEEENNEEEDSELLEALEALNLIPIDEGDGEEEEEGNDEDPDVSKRHIGSLARDGMLPPQRSQRHRSTDGGIPQQFEGSPGLKRGMQPLARVSRWGPGGQQRHRAIRGLRSRFSYVSSPRNGHHPSWLARKRPRGVRSLSYGGPNALLGSVGTTTIRYRQKAGSSYLPPSFMHTGRIWKRSPGEDFQEQPN